MSTRNLPPKISPQDEATNDAPEELSPRAFTLIELLVVIAIITVLGALAFPALTKTLEAGRRATCAGNLKTIAAGILTYASENNYALPTHSNNLFMGQRVHWWQCALQTTNFLNKVGPGGGPKCMYCPSQKIPMINKSTDKGVLAPYDFCYGINGVLTKSGAPGDTPLRITRIPNPSEILLLADGAGYDEGESHGWLVSNINPNPSRQKLSKRHGDSVNAAWLDGHVTFTNGEALYANTNAWGRKYSIIK